MSACYFSDEERFVLLSFPTSTGLPLKDALEEMQRTKGFILCSSHDLAPIIEKAFGLRKGYEKEKQFMEECKTFHNQTKKVGAPHRFVAISKNE